jgi:biopolymer transport protein ExbD
MKIKLDSANDNPPRVEVVPLIDIIFCILTFFLLSGLQMARQQAINVDVPQAKTAQSQSREFLMVSLDPAGQISIEKKNVPQPQLEVLFQQIKSYRITNPNSSIVLYADKQVKYETVIQVLDLLRQAAGENVELGTDPKESSVTPATMTSPSPTLNSPPLMPTLSPAPFSPAPNTAPTLAPPTINPAQQ